MFRDERYGVSAWMHRNADVQDERYGVGEWMRKNADVQD
jgi:hypothetical protein